MDPAATSPYVSAGTGGPGARPIAECAEKPWWTSHQPHSRHEHDVELADPDVHDHQDQD